MNIEDRGIYKVTTISVCWCPSLLFKFSLIPRNVVVDIEINFRKEIQMSGFVTEWLSEGQISL